MSNYCTLQPRQKKRAQYDVLSTPHKIRAVKRHNALNWLIFEGYLILLGKSGKIRKTGGRLQNGDRKFAQFFSKRKTRG